MIGAGITLHEALKAADELKSQGISIRVVDLYCVKPIDGKAIAEQIQATGGRLVTVEDHWPEGGVGEAVLSALAQAGVMPTKFRLLAVRDMPHSGKAGRTRGRVSEYLRATLLQPFARLLRLTELEG